MEPSGIDRWSRILVNVRPDLSTVTTSEQLHCWARAVLERATRRTGLNDGDNAPWPDRATHDDDGTSGAAAAFGLRHWERALSEVLARLQAVGDLPPEADTAMLGAAFAALVYGGLLLSRACGSSSPLRAAIDMALAQVAGVARR